MRSKISFILLFFTTLFFLLLPTELLSKNLQLGSKDITTEKDSVDVYEKLMMDRVTVVGQPVWMSNIPGAANYIDLEQLQKQSYTDINRVLRSISGIYVQEEDGFGLRPNIGIRGAGSERSTKVNIMEDGILASPAPYSAPAAYYFPNIARMNTIEVRKGSSQVKYGPNTTGGAINMISTPIPAELSGTAEFNVGERSANKLYANFGNRTERFGYLLEVTSMGENGFKELDNGGDTGYNLRDFMGKFMVQSSSDASVYQRLEFKLGYHDELSDETYLGLTRDDFRESPLRRYAASQVDQMNTEHIQLMARHFALISNHIDLTTSVYRNNFSRTWYKLHDLNTNVAAIQMGNLSTILANPNQHPVELGYLRGETSPDNAMTVRSNNRDYYSQGIESILGLNFDIGSAENQMEIGIRLHQDEEDRYQYEDDYRMEDGRMILTQAGLPGTQANRIGSATALSVYIQDKIQLNNWTFTPGLRFENIWFNNKNYGSDDPERTGTNLDENDYSVNIFVPGVGITWQASENLTLLSGIHRGFSPPSPGSSSETRSEMSVNYELGLRLSNSLIQAEVISFYNDYSNLLGSDLAAGGGSGTTAQFNAGEVEVYGLEVTTYLELTDLLNISSGNVSLPFNASYTYTNASFQSSFESNFGPWGSVETGDKIPFIPDHQFNAGLSFDYKRFSSNINSMYTPKVRTVAGSGAIDNQFSTDSYLLFDLSSSYNITENLGLFVNIRNLLDETYIVSDRPSGIRPGMPRTLLGGLKFTL